MNQEEIDKKADKYGNISFTSLMVIIVCHIIYGVIVYFLYMIPFSTFERLTDVFEYIYLIVSSSAGVVSLVFAILGYKIKRTNVTSAMLIINLVINIGGLITYVQIFGGLYLFLSSLR